MKSYTEVVRTDLDNIRKVLYNLAKHPSNSFYKEKDRNAKLELDKDLKRLMKFISESGNADSKITDALVSYSEVVLSSGKKPKERLSAIESLQVELNTLDVVGDLGISTDFPLAKELVPKLGKRFDTDMRDLKLVWGKSGNCTAFLLRRIIEKSIMYTFAKEGKLNTIKDSKKPKQFVGLETMIKKCTSEKRTSGLPFLNTRTAEKLAGIKYLGDNAAHNFLAEIYPSQVKKEEIDSIQIALGELSLN